MGDGRRPTAPTTGLPSRTWPGRWRYLPGRSRGPAPSPPGSLGQSSELRPSFGPRGPNSFARLPGRRVAQVIAGLVGKGLQPFQDVRVLVGDVVRLADVIVQVVQHQVDLGLPVWH